MVTCFATDACHCLDMYDDLVVAAGSCPQVYRDNLVAAFANNVAGCQAWYVQFAWASRAASIVVAEPRLARAAVQVWQAAQGPLPSHCHGARTRPCGVRG